MGEISTRKPRRQLPDPNLRLLKKRELVALYLIEEYIQGELARVQTYNNVPESHRIMLVKAPTSGYLWSNSDRSAMNEFFERYGRFENKFLHPNQVARIVHDLREWGILYNPNNPEDAEVGASEALIPKLVGDSLYNQLKERYGTNPVYWPDTVPWDISDGQAMWESATLLPRPAYAGAH